MSKSAPRLAQKSAHRRPAKMMYRGVELAKLTTPSTIPLEDIARAVDYAFAKNAPVIADD